MACVLRAYYCGSGRRKIERYETALNLIANAQPGAALPTLRQYMAIVEDGRNVIRGALIGLAHAA
jgi:hypothetical protein